MRAAVRTRYGGPEVVRFAHLPDPLPHAGELLVRVHATTVNRTDCAYRSGEPFVNRLYCGWPRPRVQVLGSEYAGVVEAVGDRVDGFAVGDRVFGFIDGRPGAHAELVVVPVDGLVTTIPDGWSFEEAAPAAEGAHYALACPRVARTMPGDRVLVHGATGAIGSALVQILVADRVEVTVVCDQPLPRDLGATDVVAGPYDAVFDAVGTSSFAAYRPLLATRGSYTSSNPNLWQVATSRRVHFPFPRANQEVATRIRGLMASGAFRPLVDRTYAFDDIRAAYEFVDEGRKVGNVVLTVR